jgi:hypothetical protein
LYKPGQGSKPELGNLLTSSNAENLYIILNERGQKVESFVQKLIDKGRSV